MFDGNPIYFMGLMVVLGLLPFFLMMVTSYVKIVVVTSLVRNALGVQQIPPAMVMNGLAIILTMFIMGPVAQASWNLVSQVEVPEKPTPVELLVLFEKTSPPLKEFMVRNIEPYILNSFSETAKKIWPTEFHHLADKDNFVIILPSFVVSELT
jgi:type III secretion protein R